jgi:hypothetical protein
MIGSVVAAAKAELVFICGGVELQANQIRTTLASILHLHF